MNLNSTIHIRKLRIGIYVLFLLIMLSVCKKEPSLSEKEKLIVSHGWRWYKTMDNGVEGIHSNPWELDDCWTFKPDKTFIYSYGSLKSPTMRQVDSQGTWFLSENESLLN